MNRNALTDAMFKELDEWVAALPSKEGMLIAVLHRAQEIFGYLPRKVQVHVARLLDLPAAQVNGVVTFYSFFTEEPRGEYVINVCMGTACFVRGADAVLHELEKQLGIKAGQTTADGRFTIDALRCVGACGLAPVISINEKVYGRVEASQVAGILKEYARK